MFISPWQLTIPIDAILFDCDGTLSRIEGIDELAKHNSVGPIVQRLTQDAMSKTGMNPDLYAKRLTLTKPDRDAVTQLGNTYHKEKVPDILNIIQIFHRLKKEVYIVSAGLFPAVALFGQYLKIPEKNIYAVRITFHPNGTYKDFDHHSPMVFKNGKQQIVNEIKVKHPNIAYIGDGLSDLEVYSLVTRFVGYGGAYYRENIAALCEFYIKTLSMTPLLPLVLTAWEVDQLTKSENDLYQQGLGAIQNNEVKI